MPSTWNPVYVHKPLPIFVTILEDHEKIDQYFKEVIVEHRQKYPQDIESNVKAWHSSWTTHHENPKFQPIVDIVVDACRFISKGYFNCNDIDFHILNLWAMMYEDTEWTKRHSHFPSDFAACYYVDVEPGSAPVVFEPQIDDKINNKQEPLILQPQNGMLAIWPAIIHHEVPPTKGRRMCISMNIDKGVRK